MSWLDIIFVLTLAGCVGLSAHKRLAGLFIGLGAAFILRPLLSLAGLYDFLALLVALILGGILAVVARFFSPKLSFDNRIFVGVGAIGGVALGVSLVFALAVSFPLDINPRTRHYDQLYPSEERAMSFLMKEAKKSELVKYGRYALFYKNLQGVPQDVNWAVVGFMHNFFVANLPWES